MTKKKADQADTPFKHIDQVLHLELVELTRGRPLQRGEYIRVQSINDLPSQTDPSQATTLAEIVSRYTKPLDYQRMSPGGVYGDFTDAGDFQTQMENVTDAIMRFQELPGNIREHFDHDPVRLMEFLEDPAKVAEGVEIGLYAADAAPIGSPTSHGTERPAEGVQAPQEAAPAADTPSNEGPGSE